MRVSYQGQQQTGFVSILTVIMFMLLTSIVTISFVTLTVSEQRRALNDDLSKSAYDAAQAGIEDAKRAIGYCELTGCQAALQNQTCPGFFTNGAIQAALGLTVANNAIQVGDTSANQRYTCVTVANIVKYADELDPASASKQTVFIPLKGTSGFNRVRISWTERSTSGANPVPSLAEVQSKNPEQPAWNDDWPAMLRAMFLHHASSGSISGSTIASQSVFFVPVMQGAGSTQVNQNTMAQRVLTDCNPNAVDYVCSMTVLLPSNDSWYLQLEALYVPAKFRVELFNGGNPIAMDRSVGYMIDSTGAAADVFRRVQAQVVPDDVVSPSSAIQSGEVLCKNFSVTGSYDDSIKMDEECTP